MTGDRELAIADERLAKNAKYGFTGARLWQPGQGRRIDVEHAHTVVSGIGT
jgi:hypothetical protein